MPGCWMPTKTGRPRACRVASRAWWRAQGSRPALGWVAAALFAAGLGGGLLVVRAPDDEALEALMDGDVILEIGGRTPNGAAHALRILASFEPGETLQLTIMRDQRRETLEIDFP